MGFLYTTSDLIESIKDRAHTPDAQSTYTNARILSIATDELLSYIVPMILSTQEDYYVTSQDYTTSGTSYTLPDRALGGKIKDVVVVNSTGDELNVPRIDRTQRDWIVGTVCWVQGNAVIFREVPDRPTVRIYYHIRPNRLCELTEAGTISAVGATTLDVGVAPATFVAGARFDVIGQTAPHWLQSRSVVSTGVSGSVVSFATLPTAAVGDYLSLAGTSPVVQCPYELVPLLAQKVACKIMEAEGDLRGWEASAQELLRMEKAAFKLLEPRIDTQSMKIIHRGSDIRNAPRRWGYYNRS